MIKKRSRVNVLLIEIVIVILFFSLSAAVTVQLFVAAHNRSRESRDVNQAMLHSQELAEVFLAQGELRLPSVAGAHVRGEELVLFYDRDWQPSHTGGDYRITLTLQTEERPEGVMAIGNIEAEKDGEEPLYTVCVKKYFPGD